MNKRSFLKLASTLLLAPVALVLGKRAVGAEPTGKIYSIEQEYPEKEYKLCNEGTYIMPETGRIKSVWVNGVTHNHNVSIKAGDVIGITKEGMVVVT